MALVGLVVWCLSLFVRPVSLLPVRMDRCAAALVLCSMILWLRGGGCFTGDRLKLIITKHGRSVKVRLKLIEYGVQL